ncbi:MAG TPA: 5'-nucleotidase C-terminal domain-containing protein, partial [Thermoanaerobaculia bacterium]
MRKLLLLIVLALPLHAATKVTLLHFSDYHSHALPFFTDDGPDRGGIARAVRYLRREKQRGALVFSGGDMINKGSPAWSDKYGCAEWPWLNGIVDAMAFGNHDADYGRDAFDRCRAPLHYPILSANTPGMQRYAVVKTKGIRIGVFAVAGSDFPALVKGMTFTDATAAARDAVRELRERERVDAIVMIGHEHTEEDFALARAVAGIDVIFGSHSHRKQDATVISGTSTLFLSPFQYLTYIGRVELTFDGRRLTKAAGRLVPVDAKLAEDRATAKKVRAMQQELERDPQYRELFTTAGTLAAPLNTESLAHGVLTMMREVAKADVAMSTASSFRQPLPAGPITHELLRAALPYDNEIFVAELTGEEVRKVLDYSDAKAGSDSVMFIVGGARLDPKKTYRVATTDYAAKVAAGYRELFAGAKGTGLRARA